MDADFVARLDALRDSYGLPMTVTSGYRCPVHNQRVSTTGAAGPHTTGKAVDIAVSGRNAYALLRLAYEYGFTGIGINQKGASRFVHLDTLTDAAGQPRPWVWSY